MKSFHKSCRPFKLHKMKKNKRRIKKYDDNLTSESSFLHPKWSIAPQFVESNNGWVAITSPEVSFFYYFLLFLKQTVMGSFLITKSNDFSSKLWIKGMMGIWQHDLETSGFWFHLNYDFLEGLKIVCELAFTLKLENQKMGEFPRFQQHCNIK